MVVGQPRPLKLGTEFWPGGSAAPFPLPKFCTLGAGPGRWAVWKNMLPTLPGPSSLLGAAPYQARGSPGTSQPDAQSPCLLQVAGLLISLVPHHLSLILMLCLELSTPCSSGPSPGFLLQEGLVLWPSRPVLLCLGSSGGAPLSCWGGGQSSESVGWGCVLIPST